MPRWLFWTLVTILTWGVWAVLTKRLALEVASPAHAQVVSTIGILPVIVALWFMKEPPTADRTPWGIMLALGSGIVSCLGSIALFDILGRGTKAAAVIPITALYPAVTVLLAVPLLKERLNVPQLLGIGLSLAAIYLFNAPGDEGFFSPWLIYSMVPIVLWGVCGLLQKMSTNHLSARASAIWFLLAFVPLAGVIIMVAPVPSGIPIQTWALAAGVGFTLALGNFTILLAFASGGKASIITPMTGLYFLVSIPIAIVAFDEEFVWREGLGMACALLAIVLLSYQSEPENPQSATTGTGAAP